MPNRRKVASAKPRTSAARRNAGPQQDPSLGGPVNLTAPNPVTNAEFTAALNDEPLRNALRAQGVEPAPMTPEAFEAYIRTETTKWAKVIRTANIKLD